MIRPRPTYANVASTLALVVALSGTAYAVGLPDHSVGAKQLKKNAVTSRALKNGSVTSADLANRGVRPADLSAATKALAAAGPMSPTLVSGSVRDLPTPVSGVITRFGPVSGQVVAATQVSHVVGLGPDRPATLTNLLVRIGDGLGSDQTLRVDVVSSPSPTSDANATTLLSCTVTGSSGTRTCASAGTGRLAPRSFVYVRLVVTDVSPSGGQVGNLAVSTYSFSLTPTT